MGGRVAEKGHAAPDDKAAEGGAGQGDGETGKGGAAQKIIENRGYPASGVRPAIMVMIMVMAIERERAVRALPKERAVFRRGSDHLGLPLTADMTVETNDTVRRAHHDVQIVADHQNGTAEIGPHLLDLAIKGGRTRLIEALGRLIEEQNIGLSERQSRKLYARLLASA